MIRRVPLILLICLCQSPGYHVAEARIWTRYINYPFVDGINRTTANEEKNVPSSCRTRTIMESKQHKVAEG